MLRTELRGTDEAVQIGQLMEELVAALEAGGRLRLRMLANPIVAGDRRVLQRAFLDLLANALAHNTPCGVVRVTVGEIGMGVFVELQDEERDACETTRESQHILAGSLHESNSHSIEHARDVVEAHGGGLRCIDSIDRLLLVYLPLARAA